MRCAQSDGEEAEWVGREVGRERLLVGQLRPVGYFQQLAAIGHAAGRGNKKEGPPYVPKRPANACVKGRRPAQRVGVPLDNQLGGPGVVISVELCN